MYDVIRIKNVIVNFLGTNDARKRSQNVPDRISLEVFIVQHLNSQKMYWILKNIGLFADDFDKIYNGLSTKEP